MKIKLKRKVILKKRPEPQEEPEKSNTNGTSSPRVPNGLFEQFSKELRSEHPRMEMGIVRAWYEKTFDCFPPWDEHPLELVKLKLQYELLHRDYMEANIPEPEKVKQNWKASKEFNIKGLTDGIRQMVEVQVRSRSPQPADQKVAAETTGGEKMATKPKKGGEGMHKEKVYETYIRLFSENNKTKLTDKQLAAEMCKAHPNKKKYTVDDIVSIRSLYNRGGLTSQKGAPKVLSVEFGADKPVKVDKKTEAPASKTKKVVLLKKHKAG